MRQTESEKIWLHTKLYIYIKKLSNEKFKIVVNLKSIKKSKQVAKRLNKSNKKNSMSRNKET